MVFVWLLCSRFWPVCDLCGAILPSLPTSPHRQSSQCNDYWYIQQLLCHFILFHFFYNNISFCWCMTIVCLIIVSFMPIIVFYLCTLLCIIPHLLLYSFFFSSNPTHEVHAATYIFGMPIYLWQLFYLFQHITPQLVCMHKVHMHIRHDIGDTFSNTTYNIKQLCIGRRD